MISFIFRRFDDNRTLELLYGPIDHDVAVWYVEQMWVLNGHGSPMRHFWNGVEDVDMVVEVYEQAGWNVIARTTAHQRDAAWYHDTSVSDMTLRWVMWGDNVLVPHPKACLLSACPFP